MRHKACGPHRALGLASPRERLRRSPAGRILSRRPEPENGASLQTQLLILFEVCLLCRGQEFIDVSQDWCLGGGVRHA